MLMFCKSKVVQSIDIIYDTGSEKGLWLISKSALSQLKININGTHVALRTVYYRIRRSLRGTDTQQRSKMENETRLSTCKIKVSDINEASILLF